MTPRELYKECKRAGTLDFDIVTRITEINDEPVKIDIVNTHTEDVDYSHHEIILVGDAYDLMREE